MIENNFDSDKSLPLNVQLPNMNAIFVISKFGKLALNYFDKMTQQGKLKITKTMRLSLFCCY